ncbi:ABC transporter ATP-binding protein [Nocardiopsis sp. YSL2]|uniref:ABC transporter ATP-binding protein n=1 Tax=Nocardiopsis sp. YSL2 TaxID=2939492 RepID=UPI0026F46243|nr:ABC transporter ATP-binding protein [Nocardiopsis sp. YSL2]
MNGATTVSALVRVRGLTKTYGSGATRVNAVDGVDLDIARGETLLIMGPSGSGKTTLLLMLGALLRPTGGAVVVDGVDLATAPARSLPGLRARRLGFVFQDFNLVPALTALENVALARNLAGVRGRAARERAEEALDQVGLGARLSFRPDELSGGEKQRVAVARALVNGPALLLADEPTANLDSGTGREVGRRIRDLAARDGRSVIMVSHDDRLREIASRTLWLEDGRFHDLAGMVADPVCGRPVRIGAGPGLEVDGGARWFCSDACRAEFAAHAPGAPGP